MSILITGGTGKTATHLARLLHESSKSFFIASRDPVKVPQPYRGVKFDWYNKETWDSLPFHAPLQSVYLVAPYGPIDVIISIMKSFIDFVIQNGIKRFVLLTGSTANKRDSEGHGSIHAYLEEKGVEHTVLKPTWFMENFNDDSYIRRSQDNSTLHSCCEDGKAPFVNTEDVAQAAYNALTSPGPMTNEIFVVGPELLTYDEVASILSSVTGRPARHVRLSAEELTAKFTAAGFPEFVARLLVDLDVGTAKGHEEQVFNSPNKFVGKVYLKDFFEKEKEGFLKTV